MEDMKMIMFLSPDLTAFLRSSPAAFPFTEPTH
jgi:hypothetical protein